MLVTCTDLANTCSIKGCNFEGCRSLFALVRIETTLTMIVVTTTDDILIARQEKWMWKATTNLSYFFIEYIKCINSCGCTCLFTRQIYSELAIFIVAPCKNLCKRLLFWWAWWSSYCKREVSAARYWMHSISLKPLDETWWSNFKSVLLI